MNFYNERTIDHEFFLNERHFINYCFKVCKTQGIDRSDISVENLTHFLWSLKHETVFKRNGIKPPYTVLISALKGLSKENIDFIFKDYLNELIKLRFGNCELKDCPNITKFEMFEGSTYDVTYGDWGYSKSMLTLLDKIQGKSGVYKLYDINKSLLYIGKSYTLSNRITSSIKEQHAFYCKVMETKTQSDANLLEIFYISEEKPPNNDSGFTFDKLTIHINFLP
jgi:hypothetical protein